MAPAGRRISGIAVILLVVATYARADNGSWYADNCYYLLPTPYQPARVGCRFVVKDQGGHDWLVYLDPVGTFGLKVLTDLNSYLRLDPSEIRARVYKSIPPKGSTSTTAYFVQRGGPPPSRCPLASVVCLNPVTCQVDQACMNRKYGNQFQH
jgi:hypothetical protein